MYIYIVRHGETEWNIAHRTQGSHNIELTDRGREQAKKLGAKLKNKNIKKIYTSDLKRAYETACIIGNYIGVVPTPIPLLREVSFGEWEGLTPQEIECHFNGQLDRWYKDHCFAPPNGESIDDVKNRVLTFIDTISNDIQTEKDDILLVSHGMTNRILITQIMDIPVEYMRLLRQDNTALSKIRILENNKAIDLLNDTCHLDM
ncbi:MAG: histidine phosphatase family protein [Xylanivirga thermophila]|jgi:broad specificity phosphatase PhoE|uniref:histidine phosphatase family protein n=1 Tax=Xylanivirga thermophila TaxID=2496273 RepID=UPI00101BD173|nr:histidine phosphatase family protein [Xylanivirga thermophila]